MNDNQERLLERMGLNETVIAALVTAVAALNELTRGVMVMVTGIAESNTDLARHA